MVRSADERGAVAENTADRHLVAAFCDGLAELTDEAAELGIASQLAVTRTALASGAGPPADAIRQFWAAIGLGGTRAVTISGQDPTPPSPGDYICPSGVCDRRDRRDPGGPVPVCQIYGQSMKYQP